MPNSTDRLESDAIQAALDKDWKKALKLNEQIVDFDSENVPALNRISKAFIELGKFDDAKKFLKKVLKLDPINQTAKRNLDIALAKRKSTGATPDLKDFIKEPGTTKEFKFPILTKGLTSKKFYLGEELKVQIEGHKVSLHKAEGELINVLDPITAEKIILANKRGERIKATFMAGDSEKEITVQLKASIPLFKSEKQDIKPYLKRENIEEEPETSTPETEEEESQPLS